MYPGLFGVFGLVDHY